MLKRYNTDRARRLRPTSNQTIKFLILRTNCRSYSVPQANIHFSNGADRVSKKVRIEPFALRCRLVEVTSLIKCSFRRGKRALEVREFEGFRVNHVEMRKYGSERTICSNASRMAALVQGAKASNSVCQSCSSSGATFVSSTKRHFR